MTPGLKACKAEKQSNESHTEPQKSLNLWGRGHSKPDVSLDKMFLIGYLGIFHSKL